MCSFTLYFDSTAVGMEDAPLTRPTHTDDLQHSSSGASGTCPDQTVKVNSSHEAPWRTTHTHANTHAHTEGGYCVLFQDR